MQERTSPLEIAPPHKGSDSSSGERPFRILVVDNDQGIRFILSKILSMVGYGVVSAVDGVEGLAKFSRVRFDLVLTDFRMPKMDGWQLSLRIKKLSPHTPVVMITGEVQNEVIEKVANSSIDFVVFKPFNVKDVIGMVDDILRPSPHKGILHVSCPVLR